MNFLQEAYIGGLFIGIITTLVTQFSWKLLKHIVSDLRQQKSA